MNTAPVRRLLAALGLKGAAKRAVLAASGPTRSITVDGARAAFVQRDFGDYIELNQVDAERDLIARLRTEVDDDDVFLDVGSNLGVYATLVGLQIESGAVVAVEPVDETVAKLEANLDRNGVAGTVCPVAFSDTSGRARMSVPDSHGSSSLDTDGSVAVDRVRGDEYLRDRELPTPTVVKIDVEGHELSALRGLEATLSRSACRLLYCEVHANEHGDSGVEETLESYGFRTERVAELPGTRHVVRAEKP